MCQQYVLLGNSRRGRRWKKRLALSPFLFDFSAVHYYDWALVILPSSCPTSTPNANIGPAREKNVYNNIKEKERECVPVIIVACGILRRTTATAHGIQFSQVVFPLLNYQSNRQLLALLKVHIPLEKKKKTESDNTRLSRFLPIRIDF